MKRSSQSETATINVPAVLLVGGMGTRLRTVLPDTPKPLALVGKVPFLQLLILQLRSQGIKRVVLCTGHLADQIETEFGTGSKWEIEISYSRELCPLGTAGALKLAERHLSDSNEFLVMNGDSFLELDLGQLIRFHHEHGGIMSMAVRRAADAARYGTVRTDENHRVTGFSEKTGSHVPGLINGGVYLFNREILERLPEGPASLEKEVFPRLIERGLYATEQHGMFIDIGTPEDYTRAQELYESLYQAAQPVAQKTSGTVQSK